MSRPPPGDPARVRAPWLVLLVSILASGLAFIDGSVTNVGLTAIGRGLHAGPGAMQWVVDAYLLPLGALLLIGGAAGDRFGHRRLLIAGTSLFAATSLGCALAPAAPALVAARLVQGLAAAMVLPNSLSLLNATFPGERKGRAIGIWAASGAAAAAIGPIVGGWLIDLGSWRAIFLINLPVALGAAGLARVAAPADRPQEGALDWAGAALATSALALVTWALIEGSGSHGWRADTIAAAVAAPLLGALFLLVEHRRGEHAMMPLALFGSRAFVGLTLLTFLVYGALGGLLVLVPFLLVNAGHFSATEAGASLLPVSLLLATASPLVGALTGKIGTRLPLSIGPLLVAGGFALGLRVEAEPRYWSEVLPMLSFIALGMSGTAAPLTTAVLGSVDAAHAGSASGFNSAVSRTGGLIATALVGPVLAARGAALASAFHVATAVSAAAALMGAVCAWTLLGDTRRP